jgi:hypothetical protein
VLDLGVFGSVLGSVWLFRFKGGRTFLLSSVDGLNKIKSVGTEDMMYQTRNADIAEHANEKPRRSQLTIDLRTFFPNERCENLSWCLKA